MASLIKNQILKHLSKYVKNLSADKINLSTLRGEGDLTNLELDERLLTELLELPAWMQITRAHCNRVSVRIPWTKLKSVPIVLNLDELNVEIETCPNLRPQQTNAKQPAAPARKYGFAERVIDGLTLQVNNILINFKSHAFQASLQLSRLSVESCSPAWKKCDLRTTKLKEPSLGLILLFKELQWQTLRLEARSTDNPSQTPLRLITNQARCRITLKKSLNNCAVLCCRLAFIMEDLLWVLTDTQLSAALLFANSLSDLIEKHTKEQQKHKAARKLESLPLENLLKQQQQQQQAKNDVLGQMFSRNDILETSYHFYSEKIDLHFCDDPGDGRSCHPGLKEGGAMQLSLVQLQVDYYPFHWCGTDRRHWVRYPHGNGNSNSAAAWEEQGLTQFRTRLLEVLTAAVGGGSHVSSHTKVSRTAPISEQTSDKASAAKNSSAPSGGSSNWRQQVQDQLRKLMSACVVVRISDFTLYRVSTAKNKQMPKEFIAGDKLRFALPDNMPLIHIEFTEYYYPGGMEFPLPLPKLFAQTCPIQINMDPLTVLWLNAFSLGLNKRVPPGQSAPPMLDIKIEALMPRVVFEASDLHSKDRERPRYLNLQASRVIAANRRTADCGSRADLAACLERLQNTKGGLCFTGEFPTEHPSTEESPISEKIYRHATDPDIKLEELVTSSISLFRHDLLWPSPHEDIWFVHLDPFWADFYTFPVVKNRPQSFVGTVPLTLWCSQEGSAQQRDLRLLLNVASLMSVQLDHGQYLFLLRMAEAMAEISVFLYQDTLAAAQPTGAFSLAAVLPQVDVSLVLGQPLAGGLLRSDSPLGDTESVFHDTSSLADLTLGGMTSPSLAARLRASRSESILHNDSLSRERSQTLSSVDDIFDNKGITKSQSDSLIESSASDNTTVEVKEKTTPTPSVEVPTVTMNLVPDKNGTEAKKTPNMSVSFAPNTVTPIPDPLHTGFSTVRKGFASGLSNLRSTFDAAMKTAGAGGGSGLLDDGASDTWSVRSDGSSDSDNFILVQAEMDKPEFGDALFHTRPPSSLDLNAKESDTIELAAEVREDTPSNSEPSSSAPPSVLGSTSLVSVRGKDMISLVTFRLEEVEVCQQSRGMSSVLRFQVAHLCSEECPAMSREEFQSKFASRSRGWRDPASSQSEGIPVKGRIEQSVHFEPAETSWETQGTSVRSPIQEAILRSTAGVLKAVMENIALPLTTSTALALSVLFEDEVLPVVMPMMVTLQNVKLTIKDDKPSVYGYTPPPLNFVIDRMVLERNKEGVFSIKPCENRVNSERQTTSLEEENRQLAAKLERLAELELENEILKRTLQQMSQ